MRRSILLLMAACSTSEPPAPTVTPPSDVAPSEPGPPDLPVLWINEIVSSNDRGAVDELGGTPDWVELYNPGDAPASLASWQLGDSNGLHPLDAALEVPAGGHLVLWADERVDQGPTHLPFQLSVDGDTLALSFGNYPVDAVSFGPLVPDVSLARTPDGNTDWEVRAAPTPGASNGGTARSGALAAGTCAPSAAVAEAHLLEGDTLEVAVACAEGELGEQDVTVVGPGAWDPAGALTWTTGLADAGRYDIVIATKPAGTTGVPETAAATAWVADKWDEPANVLVDPIAYTEEWGLPVLHLHPAGPITETYVPVQATFDGEVYTAQMKIRGAASVGYPKNSYTVEFDPVQLPLGALGLQNKDHLVLVTTFDDNSYVRQKLVYDIWAAMASWWGEARLTPRSTFVVVHLSGRYHGLYVAIDHVDDEFIREMGFLDGGDLYKSVTHDANYFRWTNAGAPKATLHDGWEKKEGLPLDDFTAIEALTAWAANSDSATFAAEVDTWIDRTSFMDWFLLVHHLAADDSAGKNAYLYEEPSLNRFLFTPWDFNHSLGQTWQTARLGADVYNDFQTMNGIFQHFQLEPALSAQLWERYASIREPGGPLHLDALLATMDGYYAAIDDSAARDWDRWGPSYVGYGGWSWRGDFTTYEAETAYLYDWVAERDAFTADWHLAP